VNREAGPGIGCVVAVALFAIVVIGAAWLVPGDLNNLFNYLFH